MLMEKNCIPIGAKFAIIHRAFRRELDAALREKELTGAQFGALGAIERLECAQGVEISQRAVEKATHSSHPTMSEILKKLEKKGLIAMTKSESDGRRKHIVLTDRARELEGEIFGADEQVFTKLSRGLDTAQTEALGEILDTMIANACGGLREEGE